MNAVLIITVVQNRGVIHFAVTETSEIFPVIFNGHGTQLEDLEGSVVTLGQKQFFVVEEGEKANGN